MSLRPSLLGPRRTPYLCLFLLALVAGCGERADVERYFPLAAGMHWQYRVERSTMDGTRELRQVISTRPPLVYAGVDAAVRETPDGTRYFYRRTAAGIMRVGERGADGRDLEVAAELILPARLNLQATWTSATTTSVLEHAGPPWETLFRLSIPVTLDYSVAALGASVATPAGRFDNCLLVRGRGRAQADAGNYIGRTAIEIETSAWYAPGVGLVRLERDERTTASALDHGRLIMELDRWHRD